MLTRLALIVTTRCDLHCAHCLRGLSDEKVDFPVDLLPRLFEESRPFGSRHVSFTGGETHLHPQLGRLVEMVVEAGYTWQFVIHGLILLFPSQKITVLIGSNYVILSEWLERTWRF